MVSATVPSGRIHGPNTEAYYRTQGLLQDAQVRRQAHEDLLSTDLSLSERVEVSEAYVNYLRGLEGLPIRPVTLPPIPINARFETSALERLADTDEELSDTDEYDERSMNLLMGTVLPDLESENPQQGTSTKMEDTSVPLHLYKDTDLHRDSMLLMGRDTLRVDEDCIENKLNNQPVCPGQIHIAYLLKTDAPCPEWRDLAPYARHARIFSWWSPHSYSKMHPERKFDFLEMETDRSLRVIGCRPYTRSDMRIYKIRVDENWENEMSAKKADRKFYCVE